MSEHRIELSRRVEAPPERVWEVLTDLRRAPETLSGVSSVELLTGGPYAVGTRWRETRKVLGVRATEEMWVAENDPLRRTLVKASSRGAEYDTEFELTDLGAATELAVRFTAARGEQGLLGRVFGKVLGPLGLAASRRALEQDLADIAAAAERPVP